MPITPAEVFAWMKLQGTQSDLKTEQMQRACDAVESQARKIVIGKYLWVDPDADPKVPVAERDPDLDLALIMQAARLAIRSGSPDGIRGSNDFGIIRVSRFDPDIESLLAPFLDAGIL